MLLAAELTLGYCAWMPRIGRLRVGLAALRRHLHRIAAAAAAQAGLARRGDGAQATAARHWRARVARGGARRRCRRSGLSDSGALAERAAGAGARRRLSGRLLRLGAARAARRGARAAGCGVAASPAATRRRGMRRRARRRPRPSAGPGGWRWCGLSSARRRRTPLPVGGCAGAWPGSRHRREHGRGAVLESTGFSSRDTIFSSCRRRRRGRR